MAAWFSASGFPQSEKQAAVIVMSVDNRQAPEHRFPAARDACLLQPAHVLAISEVTQCRQNSDSYLENVIANPLRLPADGRPAILLCPASLLVLRAPLKSNRQSDEQPAGQE